MWEGNNELMLWGKNPFNEKEIITGCPECKSIDSCFAVCDEPKCWEPATCGTPTKEKYRNTCGKHKPEDK